MSFRTPARRLVIVDTETGGLDVDHNDLLEVAWNVWPQPEVHVGRFAHLFSRVDKSAADVIDYAGRDFANPATWSDERVLNANLLRTLTGATIVGANPAFDAMFLSRQVVELTRAPWHYRLMDVENLALAAFPSLFTDVPGLAKIASTLSYHLEVEIPEPNHTAEGDVRTVMAILPLLLPNHPLLDPPEPA